ncbi:MAG: WG repeat-containing protein [Bacteroidetes bacterium]|nr:WG repeat-containing protein [Bacteroidota bacterium]
MKSTVVKMKFALIVFIGLVCQSSVMAQETLYPFSEKGKYGFINKTGKVVLPAQFEYAEKFWEGLAVVKQGGKRGFIDQTGKLVIPAQYDQKIDGYFSEGLACVKQGSKYFYIDKTGKTVLEPKCDHAYKFSEGMRVYKRA